MFRNLSTPLKVINERTQYKNAMAAYAETRGKLIKIVMFTVLAFVTLGGLYFGLALGAGGLCH